ncbi:MAG: PEGA domain-containing protein, partial [Myxococcota bacterium]
PEARATPAPAPAPDPAAAAAAAPPRSRSVRIDSEPAGAEVLRDGVVLGDTPLVLDVPEDARWTLVLMRAGYEARTVTIAGASPERAELSAARELRVTLLEAEAGSRRGRPRSGRVPGAATTTESPGADAPEGVAADTAPAGADTRPRTQTIRDPWER